MVTLSPPYAEIPAPRPASVRASRRPPVAPPVWERGNEPVRHPLRLPSADERAWLKLTYTESLELLKILFVQQIVDLLHL